MNETIHRTYLCLGGPLNGRRYPCSDRTFRLPTFNGPDLVYRERWLPTEEGTVAFWLLDGLTLIEGFGCLAQGPAA